MGKSASRPVRVLFFSIGLINLSLALAGLLLPLVPTTPFVLVAAYCFSKSNERFHQWLRHHRWFGTPIRDWEDHGAIGKPAKILACSVLASSTTLLWIGVFTIPLYARVAASLILLLILIWILTRPGRPATAP